MSESRLIFHDFRDEQEDSKYPFSDRATFTSVGGEVTLTKKIFADASVYVIGGQGAAYISQIAVASAAATITIQTTENTSAIATGTVTAERLASATDDTSAVELFDRYSRPAGVLVLRNEIFGQLFARPRTHTFNPRALEFAATCFIPAQEKGLRGVLINDNELVTGNILLVGYNGVVVRKIVENESDYTSNNHKIRFDVIGNPLFKRFKCAKENTTPKTVNYVRTINGSPPDEFGHFTITALEDAFPDEINTANPVAIRVYPTSENSLVIEAVRKRDV